MVTIQAWRFARIIPQWRNPPILLVGNGRLITRDDRRPLIEDGCVAIQHGLIAEVGTTAELRQTIPRARLVDARGRLIMPGLINTHMHLYSTFARGMALKDDAPGNFVANSGAALVAAR